MITVRIEKYIPDSQCNLMAIAQGDDVDIVVEEAFVVLAKMRERLIAEEEKERLGIRTN